MLRDRLTGSQHMLVLLTRPPPRWTGLFCLCEALMASRRWTDDPESGSEVCSASVGFAVFPHPFRHRAEGGRESGGDREEPTARGRL